MILDIDECELDNSVCGCDPALSDSCTISCENLFGSFKCVCHEGYFLDPESQTCMGKINAIA